MQTLFFFPWTWSEGVLKQYDVSSHMYFFLWVCLSMPYSTSNVSMPQQRSIHDPILIHNPSDRWFLFYFSVIVRSNEVDLRFNWPICRQFLSTDNRVIFNLKLLIDRIKAHYYRCLHQIINWVMLKLYHAVQYCAVVVTDIWCKNICRMLYKLPPLTIKALKTLQMASFLYFFIWYDLQI